MVAFLTLFLGLIAGVHPVAVSVTAPVSVVEVELDGTVAGRTRSAPWTVSVDFGPDLAPHELVARGLDAEGHEVSRTRQWINLPRSAAEVQILIQRNEKGTAASGRLSWESVFSEAPKTVAVSFDGRAIDVKGNETFPIPAYDPLTTHLLSASVEFPKGLRGRADAVIGGRTSSEAASELTAVAVRLRPSRPGSPSRRRSRAVSSEAEHLCARSPSSVGPPKSSSSAPSPTRRRCSTWAAAAARCSTRTGGERCRPTIPRLSGSRCASAYLDRVSFLWPISQVFSSPQGNSELFAGSRFFTGRDQGMHWLLTRVSQPGAPGPDPKFADATAVAGLHALESCARRAVVLVLGHKASDVSRYTPAMVKTYLDRIRVPLYVWTFDPIAPGKPDPWGPAENISDTDKLRIAVERLKKDLDSQAVVWVEGRHLPQQLELSEGLKAKGVTLAR